MHVPTLEWSKPAWSMDSSKKKKKKKTDVRFVPAVARPIKDGEARVVFTSRATTARFCFLRSLGARSGPAVARGKHCYIALTDEDNARIDSEVPR